MDNLEASQVKSLSLPPLEEQDKKEGVDQVIYLQN
jgi:hypothetical protein